MPRSRAVFLSIAALCGAALLPLVTPGPSPATAGTAATTTYTPGTPSLATITDGASAAPWNEYQGDSAAAPYASNGVGSVLPTYTPGGVQIDSEPNLAVYPASGSGTDGVSPYPSGTVGTPGPLDGYCGSGNSAAESAKSPARQPTGTTLPLAPAYFPHIVQNADGSLTGYFDYRPKDADEAIVSATSTDNGKDWTYDSEALEQNPGACPSSDLNDDGEGHPNVLTIGGTNFLYTLPRAAGDNAGVGMLVHPLTPTASNPLAGLPSTEQTGIDPDDFASSGVSLATTGGTAVAINLTEPVGTGPEQLVPGEFIDLNQTPVPTAASIINCTGVNTSALTGCTTTAPGGISISANDLIEQVIATVASGQATTAGSDCSSATTCTIPARPNTTTGDGGIPALSLSEVNSNNVSLALFNAGAPGRAYVDGVAVFCNQSNAYPTTKIEDCTTGPGGSALTVHTGDPMTLDPIVPTTATQTNGLVAPDGIVGVLPTYPGAPAGSTIVMYTEKLLNYYIAGETTASGSTAFSAATTLNFFPGSSFPQDLPSTISASTPVTVELGDNTLAGDSPPVDVFVPVTCTGLLTGQAPVGGEPTDTLTGCSVPSSIGSTGYKSSDKFKSNSFIAAPGAAMVSGSTLGLTGEGSTTDAQKLFKNNEDLTVLRVAWTDDGINFSDAGLTNNGIISGEGSEGANYNDINNPASVSSPSNLNAYNTAGTALATEMRFVGSAGSIIANPDGSIGMFLSGAWAGDGDSDSFNQIFYTSSTNGESWTVPTDVLSTDYTFSASIAQQKSPTAPLGISAYYSGRAYAPSVVQNPNGTLTMLFAGDRLPKSISTAGSSIGTGSSQYTIGATEPALYRNILVVTLSSSTQSSVPTQTTLSTSADSVVVGQPVTYTATVAPVAPGSGTPTGSVTFSGNAGTLCTGTLDEQSPDLATCTTTYSATGSDSVTASYGGDPNYAPSAPSSALAETINQDQTQTTLTVAPTSALVGQSVTYTASVQVSSPGVGTPTGTVTFTGDAGTLCTAALDEQSPDQASCTTSYSVVGSDSVTAAYNGDANDQSSASSPGLDLPISQASTDTSVASSDLTPVVGEVVTYIATVVASSPGSGTPTGMVTFSGNAGTLCTSSLNQASPDTATCTTTYTAPGSDAVSAAYAGDSNYVASGSSAIDETISVAQTQTGLDSTPTSPVTGQPVTYTAIVTPATPGAGTPTGMVTFSGNAGTLCTSSLNQASPDAATCTVTYSTSLKDAVTAAYGGDSDFAASTSPTLNESVAPATTATELKADDVSPVVGQSVTYTATVSVSAPGSATPTGTVTFSGDSGTLCVASLTASSPYQATCSFSYAASGSDSVTASYSGDANTLGSSSGALSVSIAPDATGTTLSTSDSTPVVGESVTYTATVTPSAPGSGTPTGTVTFSAHAGTLCSTTLNQQSPDQATCTISYDASGSDSVTASYSGDANFTQSSSSASKETISAAQTATSLSANVSSFVVGEQITFTAEVNTIAPGSGTPTGLVTFTQSKTGTLCTSSLNDLTPDIATCTVSYPKTGNRIVTATFEGTANYVTSASDPLTVSVGTAGTKTSVTSSGSPSVSGQSVTFTATVSATLPSTGSPSGKVLFSVESAGDKAISCAGGNSQTVSAGQATCTIAANKLRASSSPLDVFAGYDGNSSFQPSIASLKQVINPDATTVSLSSSHFPSKPGQAVSFTASVVSTAPGSGTPGGTVTFSFSSTQTLACTSGDTVSLNNSGSAVCKLAKGTLTAPATITAMYSGSGDYEPSSGSFLQQVS